MPFIFIFIYIYNLGDQKFTRRPVIDVSHRNHDRLYRGFPIIIKSKFFKNSFIHNNYYYWFNYTIVIFFISSYIYKYNRYNFFFF